MVLPVNHKFPLPTHVDGVPSAPVTHKFPLPTHVDEVPSVSNAFEFPVLLSSTARALQALPTRPVHSNSTTPPGTTTPTRRSKHCKRTCCQRIRPCRSAPVISRRTSQRPNLKPTPICKRYELISKPTLRPSSPLPATTPNKLSPLPAPTWRLRSTRRFAPPSSTAVLDIRRDVQSRLTSVETRVSKQLQTAQRPTDETDETIRALQSHLQDVQTQTAELHQLIRQLLARPSDNPIATGPSGPETALPPPGRAVAPHPPHDTVHGVEETKHGEPADAYFASSADAAITTNAGVEESKHGEPADDHQDLAPPTLRSSLTDALLRPPGIRLWWLLHYLFRQLDPSLGHFYFQIAANYSGPPKPPWHTSCRAVQAHGPPVAACILGHFDPVQLGSFNVPGASPVQVGVPFFLKANQHLLLPSSSNIFIIVYAFGPTTSALPPLPRAVPHRCLPHQSTTARHVRRLQAPTRSS